MSKNWEYVYPWNPNKNDIISSNPISLSQNSLIINSIFQGGSGSPIIYCNDVEIYILIEKCSFKEYKLTSGSAAISIYLKGTGSFSMCDSSASKCHSSTDFSFIYALGSESGNGAISFTASSVVSCGVKDTDESYGHVFLGNSLAESEQVNFSTCAASTYLFMVDHSMNSLAKYCNFEGNVARRRLIYMNYRGIMKRSNIIKNVQTLKADTMYGLFTTYDDLSLFVVDRCFIEQNDMLSLCWIKTGLVNFTRCRIDKTGDLNKATINAIVTIEQTFFPKTCFFNTNRKQKNKNIGVSLVFLISSSVCKKIN